MTVTLFQNARIIDPSRGMDEFGSVLVKDGLVAGAARRRTIKARQKGQRRSIAREA